MRRLSAVWLLAAIATALAAGNATAQPYPTRTVKFVLPFGPGSGVDINARILGERLTRRWGHPVVVENRPGGGGLVSINAFVNAKDDHTLFWGPVGTIAVHPYEHAKLPYDADQDMLPVAGVSTVILALAVPTSIDVPTLKDFVAYARKNPGKLNAAAATGNSEFLLSGFLKTQGLDVAKVPYTNIVQAPIDLSEGRLQFLSASLAIMAPLAAAGKLKVLAVTSRKRVPGSPDVPTVSEAGFPDMEMESLGGIFGPRGMPLALRERVAADVIDEARKSEDLPAKLAASGQVLDLRNPAEFAAGIKELRDKLAQIAKAVGIKPKE